MSTDRRRDMTKLIVAFRNFASTPNNSQYTLYRYNESSTAANFFFAFNSTDLHAYKIVTIRYHEYLENYEESWLDFGHR